MDIVGNQARIWQGESWIVRVSWHRDTVRVVGRQEADVAHVRLAPVWMNWVVTETVDGSVARVDTVLQTALPLVAVVVGAGVGAWEVADTNQLG